MVNAISAIALGCSLFLAVGCQSVGQPPKAAVSDVAVFTTLHLLAAEASTNAEAQSEGISFNNGPFTAAQMRRYFETTSTDYPKLKAHADDLLDGVQSQSAFFQAFQSQIAASVAAALVNPTTSSSTLTTPATIQPTPDPARQQLEADAKAAFSNLLNSTPADSPFDQLDRVADFYASYVIKNLRVRGDSRVINVDTLTQIMLNLLPSDAQTKMKNALADLQKNPNSGLSGDRLILIVFQAQIDPGTRPNVWTGIRLKITGAKDSANKDLGIDQIRVIRVHPTHTYALDMQTFGQSTSQSLATAFQGSGSVKAINASIQASQSAMAEEQERKRFLSRISEATSFADAAEHRFGFNFYPSNIMVEQSTNPFASWGGNAYSAKGYLEGGARDCAAMLIVPRSLASFTCDVSYLWGNIDGDGTVHNGSFTSEDSSQHKGPHSITVTLPVWNPVELLAATVGAGPTTRPAAAATQPTSPSPKVSASVAQPAVAATQAIIMTTTTTTTTTTQPTK